MKVNLCPNSNITFKSAPPPPKIVANKVADAILDWRRPFKNENLSPRNYVELRERISNRILPFTEKGEPFPLVIVGFSLKCPSPLKVISSNADRAEFEALSHLNKILNQISQIYPIGAALKIFADGRAFVNSIVGATDEKVTKYVAQIKEFARRINPKQIEIIAPEDYYSGSYEQVRKSLFSDFYVPREDVEEIMKTDPFFKIYHTFLRDFYAKDIRAQDPSKSIRESKKEGAEAAIGVIRAAESLNRYIYNRFKDSMVRGSVHAKPFNDIEGKMGLFLNSAKSNCPMPWHGAAIELPQPDGTNKFIYEKKHLLEKMGCNLIPDTDGKGAYYELPRNIDYNPNLSFKENLLRLKLN